MSKHLAEYDRFENALGKALRVSHAEMKRAIDQQKKPRKSKLPGSSFRASVEQG